MGRKAGVAIPLRAITALEVQRVERRGSHGVLFCCYVPTLAFTDPSGSTCHEKLVEWSDQARTEKLAAWLREQLRIEPANEAVG
jgi:hypothetical protein